MSKRAKEVPTPSASTTIMLAVIARKKLRKMKADLEDDHGVVASTSYILHQLVMDADPKMIVTKLAGAK
jgi:hypothetical protein